MGGGVYERTIIEKTRFADDLYVGEDTFFFSMILNKCNEISYIPAPLYCYYHNPDSTMRGSFNEKKLTELTAWLRVLDLFSNREKKFRDNVRAKYCRMCHDFFRRMAAINYENIEIEKYVIKQARKNIWPVFKSNYSLHNKIQCLSICTVPHLMFSLYKKFGYKNA